MSFFEYRLAELGIALLFITIIIGLLAFGDIKINAYTFQDYAVEAIVVDKDYTPSKMIMMTYYPENYRSVIEYDGRQTIVSKREFYNKYEVGDAVPAWIRVYTHKETGEVSSIILRAIEE